MIISVNHVVLWKKRREVLYLVIYIDSWAKFAPFWSKINYYIKVSERVMVGSRARHFKMEKEWHSELLKMNSLNLSCLFWMINFWTSLIHLSYLKLLSDSFSAKWASPKLSYIIKLLVYKNRWHHCYCASLCKLPGTFQGWARFCSQLLKYWCSTILNQHNF